MRIAQAVAGVLIATQAVAVAPALAISPSQYAVMIDDFERAHGVKSIGAGEQTPRNRCVVPDKNQQVLNPSLFEQQVKERASCEQAMNKIVESIRADKQWSQPMDQALSTLGERYGYTQAVQLREQRREALIESLRGSRWSEKLEKTLAELAKQDKQAAYVLNQARETNLIRARELSWSATVEEILRPMMGYVPEAATLLRAKRQAYLAQWKDKPWSATMEKVVEPMVAQRVPEATALLEEKRRAAVNVWIDQDYSAEMDAALSTLGEYYPAALVVLKEKKPGAQPGDQSSSSSSATPAPDTGSASSSASTPTPSSSSAAPSEPADTGSAQGDGTWWKVLVGVLSFLAVSGTALYFAWFGI
ncbi:hypothetical protein [Corynebacterium pseudogenitalium]|uniref:hypothetical protein n=1 Tax=Corynebacterium pseudogenitalium TaxID=38303 RepID=UPI003BA160CC